MIHLLIGIGLIWFFSTSVFSAPQKSGLSINESPKYTENFTHFDYASPEAQKGGTLKLAAPGTFDSLNPFIITGLPGFGSDLLFSTLMAKSEDELFTIYPYTAESYEFSKDHLSITYFIKKEATFHDGSPITPEDVIFSFFTLTQKGNPTYKVIFADVKKVEKVGERGVKFTFSNTRNRELPLVIGINLPLISKKFYESYDFSKPSLTSPLGAGPYQYGPIEAGRSITMTRVKNWWGENLPVNRYQYNFDTLKVEYFRDSNVAFESFKRGEIDFRQELVAKIWATGYDFSAVKKGWVIQREFSHQIPLGMIGFILNTRKEFLKDPRVREALLYAFDFEWLNKNIFYGSYTRHKSFFSNSPFASTGLPSKEELKILEPFKDQLPHRLFKEAFILPTTHEGSTLRGNLKKAQSLLKEAGWIIRDGSLQNHQTGEIFKLEMISQFPTMEKVALHFIKNLKSLGIKATFRFLDPSQYAERVHSFDYDILAGNGIPQTNHPGNEQKDFLGSKSAYTPGSFNLCGISDPVIDTLIEEIINASDFTTLLNYVHALDRVLLWNFYIIPNWSLDKFRIAYWNKFKYPKVAPLYTIGIYTWWVDKDLEKNLMHAKKGSL